MRILAIVLFALGLLVGGSVGAALLLHLTIPGLSWLVAVGLTKLALLTSAGFLGAGAAAGRSGVAAVSEASTRRRLA